MLVKDKAPFAKLMGALGEIYNKQVSPSLIALYFECLKDLELEIIQKNIVELLNKKQFNIFPTPAEIRQPYETKEADTVIEVEALLKWLEVKRADYDYSHDFGGTTNAVINRVFGGFVSFQDKLDNPRELEAVIRKEFVTYWKIFKKQGITEPFVRGFFEKTNTEKGFTEHEKYGYLPGEEIAKQNRMLVKLGEKPKAPLIPELSKEEKRKEDKKLKEFIEEAEKGLPNLTEKQVRENIKRLAELLKKLEKEEK